MDTRTGRVMDWDSIPKDQRKFFIPVNRDMSVKERADMQIKLYSPCACGSGKKFKFCCKAKPQ